MRFVRHAARIRVPLSVPRPQPPLQLRHTPWGCLPPALLCSAFLCLAIVNWQQAAGSQVILNKHIFQASQRKHFLLPRPAPAPLLPAPESSKQNLLLVFGTKQTVAEAAAEA